MAERSMVDSARIYAFLGRLLISTGVVLGCLLGLRLARESLDSQIADKPHYLRIDSTPAFQLPIATALPTQTLTPMPTATPTSTPTPTATPLPLPATRLSIPAIGLNISVVESSPIEQRDGSFIWDPPNNAAGHYDSSGNPGGGQNIVFNGHNNMAGEVFRDLNKLVPGDEIILLTDSGEFHYQVQQKVIIPYVGNEAEANLLIGALSAPQSSELVTLISCWPYFTFTSRIVVVAVPLFGEGAHG
ncbi:MAG TPA: sortase [Anaerolineales bacterium]|nr:sortase [Anaerolineales bacterium]